MSFLGELFNLRKAQKSFSNTSGPEKWGNSFFYPVKFASTLFSDKTFEAYNKVPEVNAVINFRANTKRNVEITAVNKITNEPSTSPNAKKLLRLINNPNWFQDQSEFIRQSSLWHDITGNEYLYFQTPTGFKASNAKAIFTLPPQLVEIELENRSPYFQLTAKDVELKYMIKAGNQVIDLISDNVIHLNDNRVNIESLDTVLKGESKLKPLRGPINNIIAAYEARNVFLTKRGALGILSNSSRDGMGGTMPIDPDEKDALQKEFKQYGVMNNQYHTIITNMSLNWQQMGVDIDKLKVFEEVREDFFKILDAYGVPQDLFAKDRGVTFSNQRYSEKRYYESTAIPEFSEWIGAINKHFGTENETWELRGDYTHLPIFQDNIKERSSALQTIVNALSQALEDGAITIEQYQGELAKFAI